MPRPARMDIGCQSSALTSTPLVLHSRAQMTRKSTALRREEWDVMDNRWFWVNSADYARGNNVVLEWKLSNLKIFIVFYLASMQLLVFQWLIW